MVCSSGVRRKAVRDMPVRDIAVRDIAVRDTAVTESSAHSGLAVGMTDIDKALSCALESFS